MHSRDEAESAKALLEGGADPNIADRLGRTPLILAAYRKSKRTVDALVDCSRTNIDAQVRYVNLESTAGKNCLASVFEIAKLRSQYFLLAQMYIQNVHNIMAIP